MVIGLAMGNIHLTRRVISSTKLKVMVKEERITRTQWLQEFSRLSGGETTNIMNKAFNQSSDVESLEE